VGAGSLVMAQMNDKALEMVMSEVGGKRGRDVLDLVMRLVW
jgi:hypothetical protein